MKKYLVLIALLIALPASAQTVNLDGVIVNLCQGQNGQMTYCTEADAINAANYLAKHNGQMLQQPVYQQPVAQPTYVQPAPVYNVQPSVQPYYGNGQIIYTANVGSTPMQRVNNGLNASANVINMANNITRTVESYLDAFGMR